MLGAGSGFPAALLDLPAAAVLVTTRAGPPSNAVPAIAPMWQDTTRANNGIMWYINDGTIAAPSWVGIQLGGGA